MGDLLFLSHRIPYPPDKGDKIRSWSFLRHLAARYEVRLGCFIDNPDDRRHLAVLRSICAEVFAADLRPVMSRLRCVPALLRNQPLTLGYFNDPAIDLWLDGVLRRRTPDRTFVFSSAMAAYVINRPSIAQRTLVDMADVDSDKWRQYAITQGWPGRAIYAYEARHLLAFERRVAAACGATVFASANEADLFRNLAPESAERVWHANNGVDAEFFSPGRDYTNPFASGAPVVVFTGAMDYLPNVDAVRWFVRDVMPVLSADGLTIRFYIVGANPTREVRRLGSLSNVTVTGWVPDVRPYLSHAAAAVAPLRIARGVQNKVLEAMAMGRPIVATPQALAGIDVTPGQHLYVADNAVDFAAALAKVLRSDDGTIGQSARAYVRAAYDWHQPFATLDMLLERFDGPALNVREPQGAAVT